MELFNLSPENLDLLLKLFIAVVLGMLLGLERIMAHKTAGMRTYALVSMGSALFVMVSEMVSANYMGIYDVDPLRMASQIVIGVGFLGAGLIIFKDHQLMGLTTAGGLWVAAGIGTAVGFGLYALAITATILTFFVFTVLWYIEALIRKVADK